MAPRQVGKAGADAVSVGARLLLGIRSPAPFADPGRPQGNRMWRFVDFLSFETQPSVAPQDEEIEGVCQHRLTLRRPQKSGRLEGRGDHLRLPWGRAGKR